VSVFSARLDELISRAQQLAGPRSLQGWSSCPTLPLESRWSTSVCAAKEFATTLVGAGVNFELLSNELTFE